MVSEASCNGAAADAVLGILFLHSLLTGGDNTVPASGRADVAETGMVEGNLCFHTFGNLAQRIGGLCVFASPLLGA